MELPVQGRQRTEHMGTGSRRLISRKRSTFPNPRGVVGLTILIAVSNATRKKDFLDKKQRGEVAET